MTYYRNRSECGRVRELTAEEIVARARAEGELTVSTKYFDDWLRRRCASLVSAGRLVGPEKCGRRLKFSPPPRVKHEVAGVQVSRGSSV